MRISLSSTLAAAGVVLLGTGQALAEDPSPTIDPADEIFLDPAIVGGEVIEIWDERPDKPFDRDTEERLGREQLVERGATNLAEALEILPDIYVREAGRGGRQIDIRAARKGSIKIIIDGVAVDDPFYGNFDLTSVPVTDIVQVRISSSPASPIDGVGGPGGVIEVHTRDAVGGRMVEGRLQGSSLPSADASATGRVMLGRHLALRVSATGALGRRGFTVAMPDDSSRSLDEEREQAAGTARLEYRRGKRRLVADLWAQHRGFMVPPGEDGQMAILIIDGETAARAALRGDDEFGKVKVQGRVYAHGIRRESTYYRDASLTERSRTEDLDAHRFGAAALVNRPLRKSMQLVASATVDSEAADVRDMAGATTGGRASTAAAAAGFQFEDGPWKLDSSAGVAVPMGIGADPWLEAKLAASYSPRKVPVTFKATGARKGRTPTLRERYRLDIGNSALGPEHALFGEVAVDMKPSQQVSMHVASYIRRSNGLVRFDADASQLMNTGELTVRGVDARVSLTPTRHLYGGASWSFTDAYSPTLGTNPLDFLPNHRADGWIGARAGSRAGAVVRVRVVGEQIDRGGNLPARATAEISGHARVADLLGSVKIGNLLDDDYQLRAGGVMAPGRTVTFTLQGTWQ